jgi:hypothetical protein
MRYLFLIPVALCLIAGCYPRGFRPPPSDEEAYTSKNNPTLAQVRKALDECGDTQPLHPKNGELIDNARARIDECMFRRGFYHVSGWGGFCSVPEYRTELPICEGTPIRSRNDYYGQ